MEFKEKMEARFQQEGEIKRKKIYEAQLRNSKAGILSRIQDEEKMSLINSVNSENPHVVPEYSFHSAGRIRALGIIQSFELDLYNNEELSELTSGEVISMREQAFARAEREYFMVYEQREAEAKRTAESLSFKPQAEKIVSTAIRNEQFRSESSKQNILAIRGELSEVKKTTLELLAELKELKASKLK